jgi:hypothetical protein
MPKRAREKEDIFERYGSSFAKTCKSMGVDPDKADVFKIFNMAMEQAEQSMSSPLQEFLAEKCVFDDEHTAASVKANDFFQAFSQYRAEQHLPEMGIHELLCELKNQGIHQSLCHSDTVPALQGKLILKGLSWASAAPAQDNHDEIDTCVEESDSVQGSCTIYILSLQQGKYYVGKTQPEGVHSRVHAHVEGRGAAWTRKYPVIRLLKVVKDCSAWDEDKETLRMMSEHGWQNVRGGRYCQMELPASDIMQIEASIRAATDKCMLCGSDDHFVST